jgi:hypothetical protein
MQSLTLEAAAIRIQAAARGMIARASAAKAAAAELAFLGMAPQVRVLSICLFADLADAVCLRACLLCPVCLSVCLLGDGRCDWETWLWQLHVSASRRGERAAGTACSPWLPEKVLRQRA